MSASHINPRVFWGASAIIAALLIATLLAALPFCFIMLLLAIGLVRQTNADLAGWCQSH